MFFEKQLKYLEQLKEMEQKWTEPESVGICLCVLFDCYCQSFFCERETGALGYVPNQIVYFSNIS